jgi:hypothetical protein
VLLVFTIATFPGEWLEDTLPEVPLVPTTLAAWQLPSVKAMQAPGSGWATLHELLVAGQLNEVTQQPRSLWSNRLVLPGIDVIGYLKFDTEDKISTHPITISLRGRQLQGAVMTEAKLRKADFTGAQLKGAFLFGADLREAKFDCGKQVIPGQPAQTSGVRYCNLPSLKAHHLQGRCLWAQLYRTHDLRVLRSMGRN